MVSIIIPTYNRGYIIQKAIDSVLAQTYSDWELIIVDDGSTDNTAEVVGKYTDERIRYIKEQENKGGNHARNIAFQRSCGEYIVFLDSDNVFAPDCLEKRLFFLLNTCADFIFTRVNIKNSNSEESFVFPLPEFFSVNDMANIQNKLIQQNIIDTNAICVRRSTFVQAGGFDENLKRYQDWELFFRIVTANQNKIKFLDEITCDVYRMADSISNKSMLYWEAKKYFLEKHYEYMRHHGMLSIFVSTILLELDEPWVNVGLNTKYLETLKGIITKDEYIDAINAYFQRNNERIVELRKGLALQSKEIDNHLQAHIL